MRNLLDNAVPQLKEAIKEEEKKFPTIVKALTNDLENNYYVGNITYSSVLTIQTMVREYKIPMFDKMSMFELFQIV